MVDVWAEDLYDWQAGDKYLFKPPSDLRHTLNNGMLTNGT
jgi:hypothetical protein